NKKAPIRHRFPPIWRFRAHLTRRGGGIPKLGNWFAQLQVDIILLLAGGGGGPPAWPIANGKPRPCERPGLPNGASATGISSRRSPSASGSQTASARGGS